jgi:hypothetical protein
MLLLKVFYRANTTIFEKSFLKTFMTDSSNDRLTIRFFRNSLKGFTPDSPQKLIYKLFSTLCRMLA